jgi:hypothetical protein
VLRRPPDRKNPILYAFSFLLFSLFVPQLGGVGQVTPVRRPAVGENGRAWCNLSMGYFEFSSTKNVTLVLGWWCVLGWTRPWSWATHCRGLGQARHSTRGRPPTHPKPVPMTQPPAFLFLFRWCPSSVHQEKINGIFWVR